MRECTLCGIKSLDTEYLNIYVIGSEGIYTCMNCRIILGKAALAIRETAQRVKLNKVKIRKGITT